MRFVTRHISAVEDVLARDPDTVWMSPETSVWGWGTAARIHPGSGPDRLDVVRSRLGDFWDQAEIEDPIRSTGTGPLALVSSTFATGAAGSVAVVPKVVVVRRGNDWWVTVVDDAPLPEPTAPAPPRSDRARYAGSSVPDVLWLEAVAEAVRRIQRGDLEKVVLARDYAVWSRQPFAARSLLHYLQGLFPQCHIFRVDDLVGASPELLVRRTGDRFESLVLAGSAPSFADPDRDAEASRRLLESDKDLWEHELAVRSVRSAMGPLTEGATVAKRPQILRLDNVQHLATPVSARIREGHDALTLAAALHPTAAVGGTPTATAVKTIAELEGMDRGRYTGPVGWTDGRGDGEFAIALRCAEISGARARLFAGAGIVSDSLPEAELDETRIKLAAMMGALAAD
jgi:menaquinone-specific isochorismate synthase